MLPRELPVFSDKVLAPPEPDAYVEGRGLDHPAARMGLLVAMGARGCTDLRVRRQALAKAAFLHSVAALDSEGTPEGDELRATSRALRRQACDLKRRGF